MPMRPVVLESSSASEVYPAESMQPNKVPGCTPPPMEKVSAARVPSTEEESAYETMTWQSLWGSQEAGRIRSRVRVLHMDELHGVVM